MAVLRGDELEPGQQARWASLQEDIPAFASPFFRPEFTAAVASVRKDVFVAQLETGRDIVGFFPFQRTRLGFGMPVGGRRSNYHGVVASRELEWDATELIRACGLRTYEFDHLLASQAPFQSRHTARAGSSIIDVSQGFDAYISDRRAIGSDVVPQTERKARKLEREIGPESFELESKGRDLLRLLMRWKSEQYQRTGMIDQFAVRWNIELIEHIHEMNELGFGGMLSVLRAGDEIAALMFGMRSRDTWHWWFPAYNRRLASYSPGMILLLRLVQEAERKRIKVIDLGKDDAVYKTRFRTGVIEVAEGQIVVSPSLAAVIGLQRELVAATRRTPLAAPLRMVRKHARLRLGGGTRV